MSVSAKAGDIIDKNMFARQQTKMLGSDLKTVVATIAPGGFIGKVYSYIVATDGNIYWVFYRTPEDYRNFNASYVKHNSATLHVPEYANILKELERKQEEKEKEDKGLLSYYIEKYAPWIVGGVVVAVAAPSILNATRQSRPAVSGRNAELLSVLGVGALLYFVTKKQEEQKPLRNLPTLKIEQH